MSTVEDGGTPAVGIGAVGAAPGQRSEAALLRGAAVQVRRDARRLVEVLHARRERSERLRQEIVVGWLGSAPAADQVRSVWLGSTP